MAYLRFASIDIGSNAVRLLCSYIIETDGDPIFKKGLLARVPIRLGDETFKNGKISLRTVENLAECMLGFKNLIRAQEIPFYRAFATSAMRDASNQKEVVQYIRKKSGINIEVITGKKEASLISGRALPGGFLQEKESLFVDVGGGSTELSLRRDKKQERASFNIGTIRLLNNTVKETEWKRMRKWMEDRGLQQSQIPIIGSGGNITRVFKLKKKHYADFYIGTDALREFYHEIVDLPLKERMIRYHFNPDRADVILPATEIFLNIIDFTESEIIYVPKSGLSDGMVRIMYRDFLDGKMAPKNP